MPCRTYEDEPHYQVNMHREEIEREKKKAKKLKKAERKVLGL